MATSVNENLIYPGCSEKDIANARISANSVDIRNHMIIKFKYHKIVVPYFAGIKILEALEQCEFVSDEIAWDYLKIIPVDDDNKVYSEPLSHEQYVEMKMRHLLRIQERPPAESVF